MIQIEAFKEDVWQAVWSHAKKIMVPVLVLGMIMAAVALILFGTGFSNLLGPDFIQMIQENQATDMEGIKVLQKQIEEHMLSIPKGKLIGWMLLMYGVTLFISAAITHLQLVVSQDKLMEQKVDVNSLIKNLISKKSLDVLILTIVMVLAFLITTILFAKIGEGSFGMMFLGNLVAMTIMIRLVGSMAASVHGNMGIVESLQFSWKNITWKRAMIILLVCIVAIIGIGLFALLGFAIFGFLGAIGNYLGLAFQLLLFGLMSALFISMLSASFFRYADVEVEGDLIEPGTDIVQE